MFKEYKSNCSDSEKVILSKFIEENRALLSNPLIESFLGNGEHLALLIQNLYNPNNQNEQALNEAFRDYYTGVKIINYISKTLYWEGINFDKQQRRKNIRYPLILDGTITDEGPINLESDKKSVEHQVIENEKSPIIERLENLTLKKAFLSLTKRQKEVLQSVYGDNQSLTETASCLNITQQGASKIHKLAIERLRKEFKRIEG